MSNAVYISASLPLLKFGDPPPMTLEDLRARCVGVLSDEEIAALDALFDGSETENSFVLSYRAHEIQMKNVIGRIRAQAWGTDVRFTERQFAGYDVTFAKMVSDAFAHASPLEREQELDKALFWLVDSLSGVTDDSVSSVYAFAVKLKICERWSKISEEAGNAAVLQIINENDPAFERE